VADAQEPHRSSKIGRFFRRVADFFDRLSGEGRHTAHSGSASAGQTSSAVFRGSRAEIDVITFGMLAIGILVLGTVIHGWGFFFYSGLFAVLFCSGAWLLFRSIRWGTGARHALLCLLLALAFPSAAARLMPLGVYAFLCGSLLIFLLWRAPRPAGEIASAAAVILFCFVAYDVFSAIIENRRNAALQIEKSAHIECNYQADRTVCSAESVAFHVPEFWRKGTKTNLIADLANIADLRVYTDSATETRMAFAAFTATPAEITQALSNFFYTQKGFLRSRSLKGEPLTLQQMMRSRDAELYALHYTSLKRPEYLGEKEESHALILLHAPNSTRPAGRDQTWLFIVDGADLAGREFLLHRIVSGFK